MKNRLMELLEKELKMRLVNEVYQMELDAFKSGSSTALFEHECMGVAIEFSKMSIYEILNYYGFEFERFYEGDFIKSMYDLYKYYKNEVAING